MKTLALAAGTAAVLCAGPTLASSTLVKLDAVYTVTEVAFDCFTTDCTGLQVTAPGDVITMSYRFRADDGATAFSPSFVGPVEGVDWDGDSFSFEPTTQLALDDQSGPDLPAGTWDVLGWSDIGEEEFYGDGTSASANAEFFVYGASDWFETNGGVFDATAFAAGIVDGFGLWDGTNFFGGVTESNERATFALTSVSISVVPVPAPAPALLLGGAVVGLAGLRRRATI